MTRRHSIRTMLAYTASIGWLSGQPAAERTVTIRLTEFGFEPRTVTVRPGPIFFVVRSRLAGEPDIDFVEVGKNQPAAAKSNKGRGSAKERLVLNPGTYEIRDNRFAQWKCTINVQP